MNYGLKNKIGREVGEYLGRCADAFETFRLIHVAISELFDEAAKLSLELNKRWYESPRTSRMQKNFRNFFELARKESNKNLA